VVLLYANLSSWNILLRRKKISPSIFGRADLDMTL